MDEQLPTVLVVAGGPVVAALAALLPSAEMEGVPALDGLATRTGPPPDAVLLALSGALPAEAAAAVRHVHAALPEAAVVALVDRHEDAVALACTEAGAQDWLDATDLDRPRATRAVRYAVERARALRTMRRLHDDGVRAEERGRLERGLLPRPLLRDEQLRCVTLYQPGLDQALLGGDFYDVVELPDGTVLALVGDVAGRGPEQAALGVRLRVAWRALVLAGLAHVDALHALEALLRLEHNDPEAFVTVCELVLSPDRRRARVRSAGHPPPLRCGAGGVAPVELAPGPPLGVVAGGGRFPATELDLLADDVLVGYTDGLLVGFDGPADRRRLGVAGLVGAAEQVRRHTSDLGALVRGLLAAAQARNGGPLADDVAVVALGVAAGRGPVTAGR